jgi:predicted RNase H-like nuclease (RuvC/YqgF family)
VLATGCQQSERAGLDGQPEGLAAARAALENQRVQHEREMESLQRQYNDILRQREAEIATLQEEVVSLEAKNEDLRDKIRMIRRDLARLQEVAEAPGESPGERR